MDLLFKISIKKRHVGIAHCSIEAKSIQVAVEKIQAVINKQKLSVFTKGWSTHIEVRQGSGRRRNEMIGFSFKGMEPEKVKEVLDKAFN